MLRWDFLDKIDAPHIIWKPQKAELNTLLDKFKSEGLDKDEFQKLRESFISEDPFIDEQGNCFVLYIKDNSIQNKRFFKFKRRNFSDPRFHFKYCKTLSYMNKGNRLSRYVAKYNLNNNDFKMVNDHQLKLKCCFNCSEKHDYIREDEIRMPLSEVKILVEKKRQNLLKPTHQNYEHQYAKNQPEISKKTIVERGSKCEECSSRNRLHVHHKNGVKDDNSKKNLTVLCYLCHSKQPFHSHMR